MAIFFHLEFSFVASVLCFYVVYPCFLWCFKLLFQRINLEKLLFLFENVLYFYCCLVRQKVQIEKFIHNFFGWCSRCLLETGGRKPVIGTWNFICIQFLDLMYFSVQLFIILTIFIAILCFSIHFRDEFVGNVLIVSLPFRSAVCNLSLFL